MIIRPITSADFDSIEKLIRKTILSVNSKDYPKDVIEKMLLHDPFAPQKYKTEREYFVAENHEVLYWIIGMKDNEIKTFFVDSDYRGKWVWTLLIEYIEECITSKWFRKSIVYSSVSGRSFYEKSGYLLIREDFHKAGDSMMLRYYLEKDL